MKYSFAIKSGLFLLFFSLGLAAFAQSDREMEKDTDLELARQYFNQEEYDKALDYLEELIDKRPSDQVYNLTFNSYLALQEWRKAEKLAKDFVAKNPGRKHDYEVDLLYVFLTQGDQKEADELVEEILKSIEEQPSRAYVYGKTFQDKGYPRLALEAYKTGESRNQRLNFDYQKALLYGEVGDIKSMYGMYVKMVQRTPNYLNTVKVLLARAIDENSDNENVDYLKQQLIQSIQEGGPKTMNELLVHVYIQEKNFRGAFTQLKALERQGEASPGELIRLAKVAANNKEYELAQKIFKHVAEAGSEDLYYAKAQKGFLAAKRSELESDSTTNKRDWEKLVGLYEKARAEFRGDREIGEINRNLSEIYAYRLGQLDTAERILEELLSYGYLDPEERARAQVQLGDLLLYRGNRWDAILYYGRAEKDFEQSPIGQEAKFKRAKAAYFVGDFKWAQGIFDVLKESTSKEIANDAMQYSLLITDNAGLDSNYAAMETYAKADLFNYQGQLDSAIFLLERMDIAFPEHNILDEAYLMKGDIYFQQQKYLQAQQSWEKLTLHHADDILADDAYYRLANLHLEIFQNREKAMELFQKIFTEFVDSFYASEARKKFREMRGDTLN